MAEEENVDVQEDVVEQEEQTSEETNEEESNEETQEEESDEVTLSKAEFKKLKRQAIAYEATKSQNVQVKKVSVQTDTIPNDRLEKLELLADGYSKDEVEAILELGGTKVLNSKLVQSAIKLMRKEKLSNDANVVPNSKAPIYKKYNQEDFNKMSAAEMAKVLQG